MFEYQSLSPYVHLASTHMMNASLPSAFVYYTERKLESKKQGRPGNEVNDHSENTLDINVALSSPFVPKISPTKATV